MIGSPPFSLSISDISRFARWSHDVNPLHVDTAFGAQTAFGGIIAHGMLSVLSALSTVREKSGFVVRLEVDFRDAVYPDAAYHVEKAAGDSESFLSVCDEHGKLIVQIRYVCVTPGHADTPFPSQREHATLRHSTVPLRHQPVARSLEDLALGFQIDGVYDTDGLFPVNGPLVGIQTKVLGLCSYLVGMEIPGLRSLFTKIKLRFGSSLESDAPLQYRLTIRRIDRKFRILNTELEVWDGAGNLVAGGELQSYFRFSPISPELGVLRAHLKSNGATLAGQTALVCGGTRGLGASLSAALAVAGCRVFATYSANVQAAQQFQHTMAEQGVDLECVLGDAASSTDCARLLADIVARHGHLDILILNACAPPRPYSFARAEGNEFQTYLSANLPMVTVPLTVALPALSIAHGAVVAISSIFVEQPVAEFAPYVALKQAVEGSVQSAAREHHDLDWFIVRPPRLQTSWNDTPVGALGAIPADRVAAAVVLDLAKERALGVALRTDFPELATNSVEADLPPERVIVVASTFVVEPLLPGLKFWFKALGLRAAVEVAPYGQVLQELLNPSSTLARNAQGSNVVLIRSSDWLREKRHGGEIDNATATAFVAATAHELAQAVTAHCTRTRGQTVLVLCPLEPGESREVAQALARAHDSLLHDLSGVVGLRIVVAQAHHKRFGVGEQIAIFDAVRNDVAHIPFVDAYFHVLATVVARTLFRALVPARKVVVVDCDNTLWGGVAGEVGPQGITIDTTHQALHRKLAELVKGGVLVCLCSKNEEDDVWRVFEQRQDLLLSRDDIVATAINWEPKSANLRRLAASLNLGIDSFIFLDDNPVECAEVRANCPDVLTIQWPLEERSALALLGHMWELDTDGGTNEDAQRTAMYREEFRRQSSLESAVNFADFIDSLQLKIDIEPVAEQDIKRAAQLTLRTNQFNFTTIRRSESEIRQIVADRQSRVWTVKVADRFGDYGLVGEMIAKLVGGALTVDTFLLSCRVLGRGVEYAMVAFLGRYAAELGLGQVTLAFSSSARNAPARTFLGRIFVGELVQRGDGFAEACFESSQMASIRFEAAATAPEPVVDEKATSSNAATAAAVTALGPRKREELIERTWQLASLAALSAAVGGGSSVANDSNDAQFVTSDEIAEFVIATFADALKLSPAQIRAIDDLDALSCDSFKVVEITVLLSERFPWIPTTLLFEHSRVSEICRELGSLRAPSTGPSKLQRSAERRSADPESYDIAVVGMSVRCAGANSLDELWQLLSEGRSAVVPVPARRPGFIGEQADTRPHWAGLVDKIDEFDADLFHVAPREAAFMDPQLRFLLEASWAALEDAGAMGDAFDSETGVFAGAMYGDYSKYANREDGKAKPYRSWESFSLANRVSQFFGFNGPSLAIDTACSSSATALHYACLSLLAGDCRQALVGGVNLIVEPARFAQLGRLGILSPRGTCRPFGDGADGTVLGEGVGVVVLKPLAQALESGDHIYGVVKGTGLSVGAGSVGFTAPNPTAQSVAARRCIAASGCDPRTISYVETHGTGTALGDPIEVRGLTLAYQDQSLWDAALEITPHYGLGSIKPNIGHLEAGAGIVGLIKLLLQLDHGALVPSISNPKPNPAIPFDDLPFYVQYDYVPWSSKQAMLSGTAIEVRRRGALNSFGVGGANVHVIVEEAPSTRAPAAQDNVRPVHVLTLSARGEPALRALAARYAEYVGAHPEYELRDIVHSANRYRERHDLRLAVVAKDSASVAAQLGAYVRAAGTRHGCVLGQPPLSDGRVVFLFTGQGSQYVGMGQRLWQTQPVFRAALDECAELLEPLLDRPLLEIMFGAPPQSGPALLDQTGYTQPAIFSLQIALVALWRSWGIVPSAVLGHSVGEIAALTVAGGMSLADGAKLIAARGRLMQGLPAGGAMLSLATELDRASTYVVGHEQNVSVAAINGARQIVISGAAEVIDAIRAQAEQDGIKATALTVSHAFHSPLMDPMLEPYASVVREIGFSVPPVPLISCVTGELGDSTMCSVQYWLNQVRRPVQFTKAFRALLERGISNYVEIGPHPVLLGLGKGEAGGRDNAWVPSLRRSSDEFETIADGVAQLYTGGVEIDWQGFDEPYGAQRVPLPGYVFQHRVHWLSELAQAKVATPPVAAYELRWLQSSCIETNARASAAATFVVVSRGGPLANILALRLRGAGHRCVILDGGSNAEVTSTQERCTVDLSATPDVIAALQQCLGATQTPYHVVFLLDDEAGVEDRLDAEALIGRECAILNVLRATAQAFIATGAASLRYVTREAVRIDSEAAADFLLGTSIWAFCRTLGLEQPALWLGLIDLPRGTGLEQDVEWLQREIAIGGDEDQVAYRDSKRRVARLFQIEFPNVASTPVRLRDGAYVVTGGLGVLGRRMATWLVSRGVTCLVLCNRRGAEVPGAQSFIADLAARGVKVEVVAADLSRADGEMKLHAAVVQTGRPLRGIVHAAGIDQTIDVTAMSSEDLYGVIVAKVSSAWRLHLWSLGEDLDLFLLFSSMSAVLGAPGRAHYAAANAFLDGLAHHRAHQGLPALSIDWGPWAEGGMADRNSLEALARVGNFGLEPAAAAAQIDQLLQAHLGQAMVVSIDWTRFRAIYEARRPRPVLQGLTVEQAVRAADAPADPISGRSWRRDLRDCEPEQRVTVLSALLLDELKELLGLDLQQVIAPIQDVFELGMDSLTAVEFMARIAEHMGVAKLEGVIDHPRIEDLARHLLGQVDGDVGVCEHVAPATIAIDDRQSWHARLVARSAGERPALMLELVAEAVAEILGFGSASELAASDNVFERGMDSLRMVELLGIFASRLGVSEATSVLENPQLEAIALALLAACEPMSDVRATPLTLTQSVTTIVDQDYGVGDEALQRFAEEAWPQRSATLWNPRWHWMFNESAERLGQRPRIWTEQVDGRVVAFTGAVPVQLQLGTQVHETIYLVDTMVLPEHRKRALGARIMTRIRNERPFSLSLGQSDEMRNILLHLGWQEVGQLNIYALPLRALNVLRNKFGVAARLPAAAAVALSAAIRHWHVLRGLRACQVRELSRFESDHDDFLASLNFQHGVSVVRDVSYLNWKYVAQPGREFIRLEVRQDGILRGLVVYMSDEADEVYPYRRATLMELLAPQVQAEAVFLSLEAVRHHARSSGLDMVVFPLMSMRLEALLTTFGFFKRDPHRYLMIRADGLPEDARRTLLSRDQWLVTAGDSDVDRPS